MNAQVRQISSSAMVAEAAERMKALGTDLLAVVENHRIVGVVAEHDLAPDVLPGDMDPRFTPVRSVMTFEAACCSQEDDLASAIEIMATGHVRRLIVLDSRGQTVGVLSDEDLTSKAGEHAHTRTLMEGEDHESPCH